MQNNLFLETSSYFLFRFMKFKHVTAVRHFWAGSLVTPLPSRWHSKGARIGPRVVLPCFLPSVFFGAVLFCLLPNGLVLAVRIKESMPFIYRNAPGWCVSGTSAVDRHGRSWSGRVFSLSRRKPLTWRGGVSPSTPWRGSQPGETSPWSCPLACQRPKIGKLCMYSL